MLFQQSFQSTEFTISKGVESLGLTPAVLSLPFDYADTASLANDESLALAMRGGIQTAIDRIAYCEERLRQLDAEGVPVRTDHENREFEANTAPIPAAGEPGGAEFYLRASKAGIPLDFARIDLRNNGVVHDGHGERLALAQERNVLVALLAEYEPRVRAWKIERDSVYRDANALSDPARWAYIAPDHAEVAALASEIGRTVVDTQRAIESGDPTTINLLAGARQSQAFVTKVYRMREAGSERARPPVLNFDANSADLVDKGVRDKVAWWMGTAGLHPRTGV